MEFGIWRLVERKGRFCWLETLLEPELGGPKISNPATTCVRPDSSTDSTEAAVGCAAEGADAGEESGSNETAEDMERA